MTKYIANATIGIVLLGILLEIIPYKLVINQEIMDFFATNPLQTLYDYANFFFPIGFLLKALVLVYMTKFLSVFGNIATFIKGFIKG